MKVLAIALLVLMSASVALVQGPPAPILKTGDVEHFIKTFPLLEKEMEDYGFKYEAREGTMTVPEAVEASNEFLAILKKHGWDDHFFQKTAVILSGYSSLVYGDEIKKAASAFEKSIKEIDSNPQLSTEMKRQLKEQMKAAESAMKMQDTTFKSNIHANDLKMIKPHVMEIQNVIDKGHKSESSRNPGSMSIDSPFAAEQDPSDLARQISVSLKNELEKVFGPLFCEIKSERKEIYGRVIVCDYALQQGNFDGNWKSGVVTAMARLGIKAVTDGNQVVAQNQQIADTKFTRLQFTTAQGADDPDSIAATFLFPNE